MLDFFLGDDSKQQDVAYGFASPMPAQSIAAHARGQTVLRRLRPALTLLNNVVCFPMAVWSVRPAAILELYRIAAKVAVAARLVENLPHFRAHFEAFLALILAVAAFSFAVMEFKLRAGASTTWPTILKNTNTMITTNMNAITVTSFSQTT